MGQLVAEWIVEGRRASTSGTWTRAASAPPTGAASTRSRARSRSTRRTTTSSTRATSGRRGGRCGSRRPTRAWRARRRLRREVRLGAGELVRAERGRGRRVAPAARLGGQALVAGDRRRARACREAAALFDESSFAKIEVAGAGAGVPPAPLRQSGRPRRRLDHLHADAERGGGIECDFTVTRLAEDRFRIVTGTAFGQHDLAWIRSHAPDDGSVRVEDVTSKYACLGLWGPAAREFLQPLATSARLPLHAGA